MGQPAGIFDHAVKGVAMHDQQAFSVFGDVDSLGCDFNISERQLGVVASEFIVIAGDEQNPCAFARLTQQFLHNVIMGLGPIPIAPQAPSINDVADKV